MLRLARNAALRCVEICQVRGDHLEEGNMLRVIGKGGRERMVPIIDPEILAALRATEGFLFPDDLGGHLSAAWVSKLCSRALPGKWTAHTLRHAFGSASYQANPDLLALAEVMGHAKVDTTRRYAEVPRAQLLRAVEAGRVVQADAGLLDAA
jgi:integrase